MAIERLSVGRQYWRESGFSHLQRYEFARQRVSGRVLDVACGVGYGSFVLGTAGNVVIGVDVSAEAIAEARAEHSRPNVSFHHGTVDSLPADFPPVDAIVSLETIEHVPDPKALLRAFASRLKPDGVMVLSAPNVWQHTRAQPPVPNEFHLHEPTYEELCGWLGEHFTVSEEWEQTRLLPPWHDAVDSLARRGATITQYKSVRLLLALETGLRRLLGKSLPPVAPATSHPDALVAETAIIPLLPARRAVAHTFVMVARRRP